MKLLYGNSGTPENGACWMGQIWAAEQGTCDCLGRGRPHFHDEPKSVHRTVRGLCIAVNDSTVDSDLREERIRPILYAPSGTSILREHEILSCAKKTLGVQERSGFDLVTTMSASNVEHTLRLIVELCRIAQQKRIALLETSDTNITKETESMCYGETYNRYMKKETIFDAKYHQAKVQMLTKELRVLDANAKRERAALEAQIETHREALKAAGVAL